jgi:5-methylthioadenosine/S-adenosylhomocysteine deaminase
VRLPNAVLLPGFVNAHTHLELTHLGGPIDEPDFFEWIQRIRREEAGMGASDFRESARAGVIDCWRNGITTVADTGDSGAVVEVLVEMGGSGIVYHEVFGPHPEQADEAYSALVEDVTRLRALASNRVRIGVSPHAPYSVGESLYRRVARLALDERLPMAVHIAESQSEFDLVTNGSGRFADAWKSRRIPPQATYRSPVSYLHALGVLDAAPLAIHAVRVDEADAHTLATYRCPVALCPRSNRAHGHGDPPVRRLRRTGVRCGLGTDSVASVGSLDLLADARAVVALGGLGPDDGLRLLTSDGAAALGLEDQIGALEPGKWGDVIAVGLPRIPSHENLSRAVLDASPDQIEATFVGGHCRFVRARE